MRSATASAWFASIAVMGSISLVACKPAEEAASDARAVAAPVDDLAAVRAVTSTDWDAANLRADAEALSQLYTEDASRLPADGPILRGRAALRAALAEEFGRLTPTASSNPVADAMVVGDWAWVRGTYTSANTNKETGAVGEDRGKWLTIARKTPEEWRNRVDAWNSDNPFTGEATPLAALTLPPAEDRIDASAADVEALRALVTSWEQATVANDAAANASRYAADAVRMNDHGPTDVGVDAIRASYATDPGGSQLATATIDELEVDGDWAWARGHWGVTFTADGQTGHTTGKWLNVSQRTPEGWKVKVEIWNRDQPLPPAPE